jgi:biopolymer transport protein ExbD
MAVQINKGRTEELFNLTPMMDVVFNLLIFFMVTVRFAHRDRALDVQLPAASEARPLVAKPKELFINIDQSGRYFADGKFVSVSDVDEFLARAVRNNPLNQSVVIRGDKRASLEAVTAVLNLCVKNRLTDYKITTLGD